MAMEKYNLKTKKAVRDTPLGISGLVQKWVSDHLKRTAYAPNHVPFILFVLIGYLPEVVWQQIGGFCLYKKWSSCILYSSTLHKMHMIKLVAN